MVQSGFLPAVQHRPKKFVPEPFEYHEELDLRVETLTNLGHGLGRVNDWVVMVPFALPKELVRVRVYRNHKNYSDADLIEVLEPAEDRVESRCSLFGVCGGCQYQNFRYEAQLNWKRNQVQELLQHMVGICDITVAEVIGSPQLYGYRSKITPHFQRPRSGKIGPIGFLHTAKRSEIIDVPECPIASPSINEKLAEVRAGVRERAKSFKKGATLLLRDSATGEVLTDAQEVCQEQVGELRFLFLAGDFFQNNPSILPSFADYVKEQAKAFGTPKLVDTYCGSGFFGLSCASEFESVIGIEVSEGSITWAKENARINGIENATFLKGSAESIFEHLDGESGPETTVVIDPPRKGCSSEFLDQLFQFSPKGVVYISCNPSTQMRDLKRFQEAGYVLTTVQPFDLFPQTRHLECVITLEKHT